MPSPRLGYAIEKSKPKLGQALVQQLGRVDRGSIVGIGGRPPPRNLHLTIARVHPPLGQEVVDHASRHEVAQELGNERRGLDDVAIAIDHRVTELGPQLG